MEKNTRCKKSIGVKEFCSECCIVLTLCTGLSNWYWNMCAMVNWTTLIENNICPCNSFSVWKILPNRIRKSHQVILGFIIGLSQEISHWCIIQICIVFQAQSLIVPNLSQQMYQSLKVYLTRISQKLC